MTFIAAFYQRKLSKFLWFTVEVKVVEVYDVNLITWIGLYRGYIWKHAL